MWGTAHPSVAKHCVSLNVILDNDKLSARWVVRFVSAATRMIGMKSALHPTGTSQASDQRIRVQAPSNTLEETTAFVCTCEEPGQNLDVCRNGVSKP